MPWPSDPRALTPTQISAITEIAAASTFTNRAGVQDTAEAMRTRNTASVGRFNVAAAEFLLDVASSLPVSVVEYGAVGDGATDDTAAIQAAIDYVSDRGGGVVRIPAGSFLVSSTITYPGDITVEGDGSQATIIAYSGAGYCLSPKDPGTRTFNQRFRGFQISFGAGSGGIDLTGVSLAHLTDVACVGPGIGSGNGTGFLVAGNTNGDAIYNAFVHCRASASEIGFSIEPSGSNDTHIFDCRAVVCVRGVSIVDSNHVIVDGCAIELCTTGVYVESTSNALADSATISHNRFEGCTNNIEFGGTATNIRLPNVVANAHVTGTAITGAPSRLSRIGDQGVVQSASSVEDAPFSFERSVASAGNPAMRVRDSATTSGTPDTLTISSGRSLGHAISICLWDGSEDTENAFVTPSGLATFSGLTVTGSINVGTSVALGSASLISIGNGVDSHTSRVDVNKASGNNHTWIQWRNGASSRWGEQFASSTNRDGLVFDGSGNVLSVRPYRYVYSATNGRAGFSVNRGWADLGTALADSDFGSSGLGTGSTVVVNTASRDMRGEVTLTVGSGPSANPTVTLTFANGAWPAAPFAVANLVGGTGVTAGTITAITQARTTSTITWTLRGTPLAGETYTIAWIVQG